MKYLLVAVVLVFPTASPAQEPPALEHLIQRADKGDAAAQFALGGRYFVGQGVSQDSTDAVKWFRLAAEQGDAAAQQRLSVMYLAGRGAPQDFVQAHVWANLAASRANGEDVNEYAQHGDTVAALLTPAQIAEAHGRTEFLLLPDRTQSGLSLRVGLASEPVDVCAADAYFLGDLTQ
jgi:TPR repeat protein